MVKRLILVVMLALFAMPALQMPAIAVEPGEKLADPVLEERARELSKGLRCLVCRNESIDESNADLARDLRILVRQRLVAGDSDDEVVAYLVDRYGEYVLLNPTMRGANLLLWLAAPLALLLALGGAFYYIRRRSHTPDGADLSADEQARLDQILRD